MLKQGTHISNRHGIGYIIDQRGRPVRYKPWLGDAFAFLYDGIMRRSIFPKKFGGDLDKHLNILKQELAGLHNLRVLELAAGSGNIADILNNDNSYTGTDISPGLLNRAQKRFNDAGFSMAEFYVVSADGLPFEDDSFDVCLCNLSLNFFNHIDRVFSELRRVLAPGGLFLCSVPVPERKPAASKIRGTLYSEGELVDLTHRYGLTFDPIDAENGAVFYFKAILHQ
ncbi:MAG: class I SAM-dependent methyltransferase [Desulfobacterales bacterium]|nr:class I SAM-dependent methyltransferase [Desulfobacterales bacterium]